MAPPNFHASSLIIGDRGLIVAGPSGSGKTALCLAILDHCRNVGLFARLVSDDQLYLVRTGDRLIARAPDPIAGMVEVRGYRPSPIDAEAMTVIDCMVRLVPGEDAPRYGEGEPEMLEGCSVPCLRLPVRNALQGVSAVCAWLELPPFGAT